ncbi:hypothetical protein SAY86_006124 [Trapa natans]|uniref:Uncharacterized protein n=1 Tax=Trapa natans TaxID=22666 RepID=A0AAN7LCP1_TRANT|nr:hypothetical protein SAY86_006124 [Trapa natans]
MSLNMDPRADQQKLPRIEDHNKHLHHPKLGGSPFSIEDIHRNSPLMLSPRSHVGGCSARHPASRKWNYLCSPTTHAGSFRCRLHRGSGLTRAHHSASANLSDMGAKSSTSIIDSLRREP